MKYICDVSSLRKVIINTMALHIVVEKKALGIPKNVII
jgi:hypothetical protein